MDHRNNLYQELPFQNMNSPPPTQHTPPAVKLVNCVVCTEDFEPHDLIDLESSLVCHACVTKMFQDAIDNEKDYPPRWGPLRLRPSDFPTVLTPTFCRVFRNKEKEYLTPPSERIYCANHFTPWQKVDGAVGEELHFQRCGAFVGRLIDLGYTPETLDIGGVLKRDCDKCDCPSCLLCGATCSEFGGEHKCEKSSKAQEEEAAAFKDLVKGKEYQVCPSRKCKRKVELWDGCNDVHCMCGERFCYVCAEQVESTQHWRRPREEGGCPRFNHPSMENARWDDEEDDEEEDEDDEDDLEPGMPIRQGTRDWLAGQAAHRERRNAIVAFPPGHVVEVQSAGEIRQMEGARRAAQARETLAQIQERVLESMRRRDQRRQRLMLEILGTAEGREDAVRRIEEADRAGEGLQTLAEHREAIRARRLQERREELRAGVERDRVASGAQGEPPEFATRLAHFRGHERPAIEQPTQIHDLEAQVQQRLQSLRDGQQAFFLAANAPRPAPGPLDLDPATHRARLGLHAATAALDSPAVAAQLAEMRERRRGLRLRMQDLRAQVQQHRAEHMRQEEAFTAMRQAGPEPQAVAGAVEEATRFFRDTETSNAQPALPPAPQEENQESSPWLQAPVNRRWRRRASEEEDEMLINMTMPPVTGLAELRQRALTAQQERHREQARPWQRLSGVLAEAMAPPGTAFAGPSGFGRPSILDAVGGASPEGSEQVEMNMAGNNSGAADAPPS